MRRNRTSLGDLMRRTTIALLAAGLALTGCSNSSSRKADAKPSPKPSATEYTLADCTALLEKNYQNGTMHNAKGEPQCRDLTQDQYGEAVKAVLKSHVDDIMGDAADKVQYDEVWDSLKPADQQSLCNTMNKTSPQAVGALLDAMVKDSAVDTTKMAQYFYDKKC